MGDYVAALAPRGGRPVPEGARDVCPLDGAYVIGALSGYGMMASNGASDLLADYIAGRPPPRYAPAFRLDRYDDSACRKLLENWGDSGQL